jgi:hypothetical protein
LNNDKFSLEGGPASKKQRISHFKKDVVNHDNNRLDLVSSLPLPSDNLKLLTRRRIDSRDSANLNPRSREYDGIPMRSSTLYGSSVTPNAQESEDSGLSLSFTVLNSEAAKRISNTSTLSDHDQKKDSYEEQTNQSNKSNGSAYDFSQYSRITSIDQRRQYKREFDKDFAEYHRLYAHTQRITRRFTELEEQFRQVSDNEQLHEDIKQKIIMEFKRTSSDSQHQEDKERFRYLHQKLSHIKQLVMDYDKSIIINGGREIEQENY